MTESSADMILTYSDSEKKRFRRVGRVFEAHRLGVVGLEDSAHPYSILLKHPPLLLLQLPDAVLLPQRRVDPLHELRHGHDRLHPRLRPPDLRRIRIAVG